MPTKAKTPKGEHRDVTRALEIAKLVQADATAEQRYLYANELVDLLTTLDARTGTVDPTKRPKRKPVAKKAAKRTKRAK